MGMPAGVQVSKSLKNVPLLSTIGDAVRSEIEAKCSWRQYTAGGQIVRHSDEDTDVYFVISGVAKVRIYSASGKVVSFRKIGAGDFFGEYAGDRRESPLRER